MLENQRFSWCFDFLIGDMGFDISIVLLCISNLKKVGSLFKICCLLTILWERGCIKIQMRIQNDFGPLVKVNATYLLCMNDFRATWRDLWAVTTDNDEESERKLIKTILCFCHVHLQYVHIYETDVWYISFKR